MGLKRKIIKINRNKCTGCGACIPDCPEGALKIVNGKAKLVKESLCDGLGACLGNCPEGALTIEEREADEFNEKEAGMNMKKNKNAFHSGQCPGMMTLDTGVKDKNGGTLSGTKRRSALNQWPVQLKLLNPEAPYFKNADLLIAADCVPFSFSDFHDKFLVGKTLIIFCPKLDSCYDDYLEKLKRILRQNEIKSVTVVHMEVPCCGGTVRLVKEAVEVSGKNITVEDHTVSLRGELIK